MDYTRRDFGKPALAGLPTAGLLLDSESTFASVLAKPDSKWAGVQVGMNVPYNFGTGNFTTGDVIIQKCVELGVSGTELRAQPVELFLGSPAARNLFEARCFQRVNILAPVGMVCHQAHLQQHGKMLRYGGTADLEARRKLPHGEFALG